jgi:hypothetical protein
MKKFITPLIVMAIVFSAAFVMGGDAPAKIEKSKIESVAEAPTGIQIEHKEAYKIDDAEYKGAVISKSSFGSIMTYAGLGAVVAGIFALIVHAFKRMSRRAAFSVSVRLLLASVILYLSVATNPLAGMVLAGIVMAFPSLKSWATQKRYSRLAEGEQEETDELKAIQKVADQIKEYKIALGEKIDKTAFEALENKMTDAVAELKLELKNQFEKRDFKKIEEKMATMNDVVTELREEVAKTKENPGADTVGKPLLTTKEVQDFVAATFKDNQKTSNNAAIKLNSKLVLKAAETFGYASFFEGGAGTDISAFTGRMVDPTLYQRKRKRNLILDHFAIESITVPKLIYLEKKEVSGSGDSGSTAAVGGADWIASGETKPMRSFRVTTGEVEAKKLAIFGTVEDKLLRDVPSLENWIREDFTQEMRETYNDGLLNNNPAVDADAPLGLKTNAIQFSATAAFDELISDPNYIDMIVAAIAKMSDLKEQPGKVFIAADVFYAILILKDNENRYQDNSKIFVNSLGQMFIGGVEVVPADSEDVPSTHFLLTSVDPGFKIKNYGPVVFERGLNGTDFREDKTSYRGYQEVLSYIPEHRENTIMYDTWANVEAAITAPAS